MDPQEKHRAASAQLHLQPGDEQPNQELGQTFNLGERQHEQRLLQLRRFDHLAERGGGGGEVSL